MIKYVGNLILQWLGAVLIAALIMNVICFAYNRSLGWIDRENGATFGIWYPNKYLVHGTEGYGIYKVDSRGYLNNELPLEENYILVVGSSYTQGKEVLLGNRFSDLLNKKYGYNNTLKFYNLSQDSYYFPDIMNGFKAIISEFPKSSRIIIEIGNTFFSKEEMLRGCEFREYDKSQNGEEILKHQNAFNRIKLNIKNYFPLLYNIKTQFDLIKNNSNSTSNKDTIDLDEYRKLLNISLKNISNIYNGKIIFLYHPEIEIDKYGEMHVIYSITDEIFKNVCDENNIVFIDVGDSFYQEYNDRSVVPYGFSNTSLGVGHLNDEGHQIIANEIYKYMIGEN